MKQIIRLTEQDLRNIVAKTAKRYIDEMKAPKVRHDLIHRALHESVKKLMKENVAPSSFIGWAAGKILDKSGAEPTAENFQSAVDLIDKSLMGKDKAATLYSEIGDEYSPEWDRMLDRLMDDHHNDDDYNGEFDTDEFSSDDDDEDWADGQPDEDWADDDADDTNFGAIDTDEDDDI